ncbi:MAG: DNA polymerase III subunit delta [Deltaproteobacteria bacterium]|nr:DNA polymerase III subunit delta [Deltaproteobacteria bacterium]
MKEGISPELILKQCRDGRLSSLYLFHGPCEFLIEKTLDSIRKEFMPEAAKDFNLHVFYGDSSSPGEIIETASSLPFLSENRLIIVRRADNFTTEGLEAFIPYLENPVESTCLIFVSSKPNFNKRFYKKIMEFGHGVNFKELDDRAVVPWLKKTAKEIGLSIDAMACIHLQEIVGNQLRELYSELEKLYLRYGDKRVGVEEVKELAIFSRSFTVFELMDEISLRRKPESLSVLKRFMEEEKDGALRILGMLNRQIGLLLTAKSVISGGGQVSDVARKLKMAPFFAKKVLNQSSNWTLSDLERSLGLLYKADGLLKSGSDASVVIENTLLSL